MPCSSRACRLENELTNGSLGTIFHFTGSPFWHARASLPWTRRGELLRRNNLPQMVLGQRRGDSLRLWRGLRLLVGHLGECTGRDPKNKDRGAPHTKWEARHTRSSAVHPPVFTRASGCSEWLPPATAPPMLRGCGAGYQPAAAPVYGLTWEGSSVTGSVPPSRQRSLSLHGRKLAKLHRHDGHRYGVAPQRSISTVQRGG
jgi:hypothetical protein